jgi:hypothetical protein
MSRPSKIHATSVSISTNAPRELAEFYSRLLGVEVSASEGPRPGYPPSAGWAQLRPAEGKLDMTVNFEWDEHYVPPVWPTKSFSGERTADQQVMAHLDLWVDDLDEAEAWALSAGASTHPHQPQSAVRVMLDPHGHPFCLFTG